jgi:hypothetical protein
MGHGVYMCDLTIYVVDTGFLSELYSRVRNTGGSWVVGMGGCANRHGYIRGENDGGEGG